MLRPSLLAVLAAALAVTGCGSEPQQPPDVGTPGPAGSLQPLNIAGLGFTVRVPSAWKGEPGPPTGPLVASYTSGRATIAVWRYPRTEPLPRTKSDLEATRDSLIAAVKARDPKFTVIAARILRGTARRGVEIIGTGTNSGFERRGRTLHLFGDAQEVVVDASTTSDLFATLDGDVFRPVAASLRISPTAS